MPPWWMRHWQQCARTQGSSYYLIEMALIGAATHLVTEDKDLLEDADIVAFLHERGIAVVTLVSFLQLLRS